MTSDQKTFWQGFVVFLVIVYLGISAANFIAYVFGLVIWFVFIIILFAIIHRVIVWFIDKR